MPGGQALGIIHERIPPRTPDLNAYIESFHSILEAKCYTKHEFETFKDAYEPISAFMAFYNKRQRHGSLRYGASAVSRSSYGWENHGQTLCRVRVIAEYGGQTAQYGKEFVRLILSFRPRFGAVQGYGRNIS